MANNEQVTVKAAVRQGRGKNDSRRLRAAGKVPVTVYGGNDDAIAAVAELRDLAAILRSSRGASTIFNIDIDGIGVSEVMFADRQIDPLKGRLRHADLRRIVRGQQIEVTVPVHVEGEPVGVTEGGGILETVMHEVHIRCRPSQIPDAIHADVSGLNVKESLHIGDIKLPEGVEILGDPTQVVATVTFVSDADLESALTSQVEPGEPEIVEEKDGDEE